MHGPTCIFRANLTPFSRKGDVAVALQRMQNLATFLAPYHLDRHSTAEGLG